MAEHTDMGPAAFMWPPDRVWSAAADNHSPCGSVAGVGNRTEFPLSGGQIALVTQDDAWDLELSIAHTNNPRSNSDFDTLIDVLTFRDLELGHTCITVDDSEHSFGPGDNATLQIKYISEFDTPDNQTFYACADIYYVEEVPYNMTSKCFNATLPEGSDNSDLFHDDDDEEDSDKEDSDKDGSDKDNADQDGSSEDDDDEEDNDSGSGGSSALSGGAIAGIVIGVVAGVGAIAAGALFFYRKRQQQLRAARQRESARNIKVDREDAIGKNSGSSVRMQNL